MLKKTYKILIKIIFVLIFSIYFLSSLTKQSTDAFFDLKEEDLNTHFEDNFFTVGKDGKETPATFPVIKRLAKNEKLILRTRLPENISNEKILLLLSDDFEDYKVSLEGIIIANCQSNDKGLFSKNSGPAFIRLDLITTYSGKVIDIIFDRPSTIDGKVVINNSFYGDRGEVYMDCLYSLRIEIFLLIILTLVDLTLIIQSIILRKTKAFHKSFFFVFFAAFIGNWFAMQTNMYYYFLGNKMVHLLLEEIVLCLGNICFINYLLSYDFLKEDKFILMVRKIIVAMFYMSIFLWVFGILEFCVISTVITIVSVIAMIRVFILVCLSISRGNNDKNTYEIFFIVLSLLLLASYSIFEYIKIGYVSRLAFEIYLLVSGLYMTTVGVKETIFYTKYTEKAELYETLAIKDTLTGLFNQNAFILDMEEAAKDNDSFLLSVFDVNNLKSINDNYGHAEGDRAIKRTADILNEVFADSNNKIYRMGGDEFAIAITNFNKEILEDKLTEFEKRVKSANEDLIFDFNVAFGYAEFNGDLNITKEEADKNMYLKKNEIKGDGYGNR